MASRERHIWLSMMSRCYKPSNNRYCRYGARGITVCKKWHNFDNFLMDMGVAPKGKQLDRVDNDKSYCKSNCRWVTPSQNSRNRSSNRIFEYDGKKYLLIELSEQFGIEYKLLHARLTILNWSVEKAIRYRAKLGNNQFTDINNMLKNKKIGMLKVLKRGAGIKKSGHKIRRHDPTWVCLCECGKEIEVEQKFLLTEETRSCGCF